MKALVLVLDGLPARHVDRRTMPATAALAVAGGWAPDGGRGVMTTSRAPNLATLVTGATPNRHGIPAAHVPTGAGVVAAHVHGPAVPSLFDACRGAGRSTGVVVADPRLLGLLGAGRADEVRSVGATFEGVAAAATVDDAAVEALVELLADPPDLVVGHLGLPDAAAGAYGPDDGEALERYRQTDGRVAMVRDALRSRWAEWAVAVVSDHDQAPVLDDREPVDLQQHVDAWGLPLRVVPEGGAALVLGVDRRQGRWLEQVGGVAGSIELGVEVRLVWARPGRVLAGADSVLPRSVSGGPSTTAQVAVVAGGHPAVERIASSLRRRSPSAADWAATLASLLGVPLPTATGRNLLTG